MIIKSKILKQFFVKKLSIEKEMYSDIFKRSEGSASLKFQKQMLEKVKKYTYLLILNGLV